MDKTIPVLMNNYITNENIPGVAVISKHGTAEINIPLNHPLTIDIDYAKNNQTIYIEPGDTLLIKLDKKELFKKHTKPVKYYLNFNRPAYMGKQAYINRDIFNLGNYKGEVSFYKNINSKDFSFEDYKTQYLNYYNKSIEYIDRRGDELQVSEISKRLAKNNFTGLYVSEILDYSQERNKVVNNEDFSFISEFDFTDKYLISTDRFRILINRYEYINFRKYYTQYVDETKLINDFFKELDNKNIKYDPKYKDSLMCSISGSEIHSSLTIEEKEKAALAKENFIKQYNEDYKP